MMRSSQKNEIKRLFLIKTGKEIKESDIYAMFKTYSKGQLTPHMMSRWYGTISTEKFGTTFTQQ